MKKVLEQTTTLQPYIELATKAKNLTSFIEQARKIKYIANSVRAEFDAITGYQRTGTEKDIRQACKVFYEIYKKK